MLQISASFITFLASMDENQSQIYRSLQMSVSGIVSLILLHSEWPKLYGVLALLSAVGLNIKNTTGVCERYCQLQKLELPQVSVRASVSHKISFVFFKGEYLGECQSQNLNCYRCLILYCSYVLGHLKIRNFPFVPNGKCIIFICSKIWVRYSLIVMC